MKRRQQGKKPNFKPVSQGHFQNGGGIREKEEKKSPLSLVEGIELSEAAERCTPAELKERIFDLEGQMIKIIFFKRQAIKQTDTDEYETYVYDGDGYSRSKIMVIFSEEAYDYIKSVKTRYPRGKKKKKYTLYGVTYSAERFRELTGISKRGPVFIPIGRALTKKALGKIAYKW